MTGCNGPRISQREVIRSDPTWLRLCSASSTHAAALGNEKLDETGVAIGTPIHMSPEQASGERDADPRSDIYALGCVWYEMLVGEPACAARHLSCSRQPLSPSERLGVVNTTFLA